MSDKIREALQGMLDIVDDSEGVAGYHRNGVIAEWHDFPEVDVARAALTQQPAPPAAERPDTIPVSRELANHREIAELLLSIGWKDTADAQWERLRKALPELHALLSGGDTPYKEIAACANTTGSTPAA